MVLPFSVMWLILLRVKGNTSVRVCCFPNKETGWSSSVGITHTCSQPLYTPNSVSVLPWSGTRSVMFGWGKRLEYARGTLAKRPSVRTHHHLDVLPLNHGQLRYNTYLTLPRESNTTLDLPRLFHDLRLAHHSVYLIAG
jgi:hypothetical protein